MLTSSLTKILPKTWLTKQTCHTATTPHKKTSLASRYYTHPQSRSYCSTFYEKTTFSPKIHENLARIDQLRQQIHTADSNINDNLRTAIQQKLKYSWIYHSNAIEGNTLTLGDTIFLLGQGITVSGRPLKDILETKNHGSAINYLYDFIASDREFNTHFLKSIHGLIFTGISTIDTVGSRDFDVPKPITPGEYKKDSNYVIQEDGTIHHYLDPIKINPEMEDLFKWINAQIYGKKPQHPVIVASIAHYNISRIHPFVDGNGRCARILMNLILLKQKHSIAIVKVEERRQYLNALSTADKGNINPLIELVSDSVITTQKTILSEIERQSL